MDIRTESSRTLILFPGSGRFAASVLSAKMSRRSQVRFLHVRRKVHGCMRW